MKMRIVASIALLTMCLYSLAYASGESATRSRLLPAQNGTATAPTQPKESSGQRPNRPQGRVAAPDNGEIDKTKVVERAHGLLKEMKEVKNPEEINIKFENGTMILTGPRPFENTGKIKKKLLIIKGVKNVEFEVQGFDSPGAGTTNGSANSNSNANVDVQNKNVANNNLNSNGNTNDRDRGTEESTWDSLSGLFFYLALILASLLILALIGYGLHYLKNRIKTWIEEQFHGVRRRQDEFANKIETSMITFKKENSTRLAEMQGEVKSLKWSIDENRQEILDGIRMSAATSALYANPAQQVAVQKEPVKAFPVAAEEYMSKVRSNGVLVKPDFQQSGILVPAMDNNGELMLVQDHGAMQGGLLYVIPSVVYFQTKQDFNNYYDRYYECHKPAVGDVWIVEPAVVDKVSGGWQLRKKGELEVR